MHGTGGRVFLFTAGPGVVGQGAVKDRERVASYCTENEPSLYIPVESDKDFQKTLFDHESTSFAKVLLE